MHRMGFLKPENALKRSEEFIEVGKKRRALDTLYEVLSNKRNHTWTKIHEAIMRSYLSLCVELKDSHMAKDGLHQYRTICQNVNVKSLEDVITSFLQMAEERADQAKKNASIEMVDDVDDLEVLNSPESLLLRAVSGESSQDRADRDLLAPWLKFVWESYKQCLELLKNNNKVETLYQAIAKLAFAFCVKYQRKTEFRKLCETMRQHMVQSQKYQSQATSIDLNKPETQNNFLETRLAQLNHAISMELWQEAYKAVEDIYGLMSLSRTKPKPSQMFNYYSKLSMVFWKAGNHLFHAATLHKMFVLLRELKKTVSAEEQTRITTRLLLATLAIPIPANKSPIDECLDQDEVTLEKQKRLSSLLGLQSPPTRLALVKNLSKYNIFQYVYPECRELYKWLEVEFSPLKLGERVTRSLEFVEAKQAADPLNEFAQYVPSIKDIAVTRLVKQLAQIYTSMELARFYRLAPQGMHQFHLEKLIVDAAKQLDLQARLNHQTKSIHFGNELYVAQKEDLPEGPTIQAMPSEHIRNQLIMMSEALQQAQEMIQSSELKQRREELALAIAQLNRQTCEKHHYDLLRRKQLIEEQKEVYERIALEREQAEKEAAEREERERRLKVEEKERGSGGGARGPASVHFRDEAAAAAAAALNEEEEKDDEVKRQIEQARREQKELNERLKKEEKKYDHFVRACYEVEIPLKQKLADEDAVARKLFWDEKELERIENLKMEREVQAENRERLMRMKADKEAFESMVHAARREEYDRRVAEFQVKLAAMREQKLAERREQRKVERRVAYLRDIEERKKREEDERRARDDEERRRKLAEQTEKQRLREKEIEEKLERDRKLNQEKEKKEPLAETSNVYRPRAAGGLGFVAGSQPLAGSGPTPVAAAAAAAPAPLPPSKVETESTWRSRGGDDAGRDEWSRGGNRGEDSRGPMGAQRGARTYGAGGGGDRPSERGGRAGGESSAGGSGGAWQTRGAPRGGDEGDSWSRGRMDEPSGNRGMGGRGPAGGQYGDRDRDRERGQGGPGGDRPRMPYSQRGGGAQSGPMRSGNAESRADAESSWRRPTSDDQ